MNVHIREAVVSMLMVDGDSVLTPPMLERVVTAVLRALQIHEADDRSRRRDTHLMGPAPEHRRRGGQGA